MSHAFYTLLAALAVASCAPSPQSRNHAAAEAVLAGTPDFENASTAERAAIRHVPSGMVCVLPSDGAFTFDVFPAAAVNPGAHCSSASGEVAASMVVTRFGPGTTLDSAFQAGVMSLLGSAQPTPWPGAASSADSASPEGLPHFRMVRLVVRVDGQERYLRVAMSEARGWYLQQVVAAPLAGADAAEAEAGAVWRDALPLFAAAGQD